MAATPSTKTEAQKAGPPTTAMQIKSVEALMTTPAIAARLREVKTKYLTPERLTNIMLTEVARPDKSGKLSLLEVAQANPASFLRAMMFCSQLGLEPGPSGLVHLIPFKGDIQVIIGFKGYINLACRSGFRAVEADVIHEHDEFDWARGTDPYIKHKPQLQNRGAAIGAYAVAWPEDGGPPRFSVLNLEDIHAARAVSQSFQSGKGPWFDFEGEMFKKTAIRRGQKQWNLQPDSPLAIAQNLDDDAIEVKSEVVHRKAPPTLRAALQIETPAADVTPAAVEPEVLDGFGPEAA